MGSVQVVKECTLSFSLFQQCQIIQVEDILREPVEAVASPQPNVNRVDSTGANLNCIQTHLGMILFICQLIIRNTCVMLMRL